jgi:hypothetical protein
MHVYAVGIYRASGNSVSTGRNARVHPTFSLEVTMREHPTNGGAGSETGYNISTDLYIACATLAPYLHPFMAMWAMNCSVGLHENNNITADMKKSPRSVSALTQLCENSAELRTSKSLRAAWEST